MCISRADNNQRPSTNVNFMNIHKSILLSFCVPTQQCYCLFVLMQQLWLYDERHIFMFSLFCVLPLCFLLAVVLFDVVLLTYCWIITSCRMRARARVCVLFTSVASQDSNHGDWFDISDLPKDFNTTPKPARIRHWANGSFLFCQAKAKHMKHGTSNTSHML